MTTVNISSQGRTERSFLCGVIEGFYGQPWSSSQRKRLFNYMQSMQLNAYMYAPKDDNKHRSDWRQLYSDKEARKLRTLIGSAHAADVTFIYALSPGLDITYSQEGSLLNAKLAQVRDLGCRAFALLFDDINPALQKVDKAAFKNPAEAQCAVTNAAFEYLGCPLPFLFCPTEYCASRAKPCVKDSPYLITVGANLAPEIGVFWTGTRVVSETITAASIQELAGVLNRPPVIWDNLHANDYDPRRLYLGPYSGRDVAALPLLGGVLTNPNCEFEANYIAIHTLAQWSRCRSRTDDDGYHPEKALRKAVIDWLPAFNSGVRVSNSENSAPVSKDAGKVDSSDEGDDEDDSPSKAPLTMDELLLMCHLFYLPFSYGETAIRLMDEFHWLRVEHSAAGTCISPDWLSRAVAFKAAVAELRLIRSKLDLLPCRYLALQLMPFIADACQALGLLNSYLLQLSKYGKDPAGSGRSLIQLQPPQPYSVGRGGVAFEFQRLLPVSAAQSLQLHRVFAVRHCSLFDMGALAELTTCTEPALQSYKMQDALSSSSGFCLEDAYGVCAFSCVLPFENGTATGSSEEYPLSCGSPLLHLSLAPAERCKLALGDTTDPLRRLLDRCIEEFKLKGQNRETDQVIHCLLPKSGSPASALAMELCDNLGFHLVEFQSSQASVRSQQILAKSL